jgi:hypothetical protein
MLVPRMASVRGVSAVIVASVAACVPLVGLERVSDGVGEGGSETGAAKSDAGVDGRADARVDGDPGADDAGAIEAGADGEPSSPTQTCNGKGPSCECRREQLSCLVACTTSCDVTCGGGDCFVLCPSGSTCTLTGKGRCACKNAGSSVNCSTACTAP